MGTTPLRSPRTICLALLALGVGVAALHPGCAARSAREACDDGIDNDGDGATAYRGDP